MTKAIDVLRAHQSGEESQWRNQAQWHVDNWGWLKHSTQIALRARSRMVSLGMTQKDLAEHMGCTQQYVSLILKGKENLTLETISKLESVLDYELITHPQGSADGLASFAPSYSQYLNDSSGENVGQEIQTNTLVDGYKRRKKRASKKDTPL